MAGPGGIAGSGGMAGPGGMAGSSGYNEILGGRSHRRRMSHASARASRSHTFGDMDPDM